MTQKGNQNLEILEMSITPDYVPHWDIAAALREFLQNALDAQTQGFKMELLEDKEGEGDEVHIINYETNLPLKTLLLGVTTKADSVDEIGQFGEGYKLACLVLTRNHVPIKISSPQGTLEPYIGYSENYETDILSFFLEREKTYLPGVRISFPKSDIPLSWLKSFILEEEPQTSRILRNQPGRVYSSGLHLSLDLKMDDLEDAFHWGYNLSPSDLKLDRDRKMVSPSSLREALVRVLRENATPEEIYEALETPFPEFKDANFWGFSEEDRLSLRNVFESKYGEKAYAVFREINDSDRVIKKAGFSPVAIKSNSLFKILELQQLTLPKLIQAANLEIGEREPYSLNFEEQKNFDDVYDFLWSCEPKIEFDEIFYRLQKIKIVPVLFTDPMMRGLYEKESDSILISGKVYKNKGELTVLILHELVHTKISGHKEDFQDAFDNLIIKVLDNSIFEKGR